MTRVRAFTLPQPASRKRPRAGVKRCPCREHVVQEDHLPRHGAGEADGCDRLIMPFRFALRCS